MHNNTIKNLMESLDMLSAKKESADIDKIYVDMYDENKKKLQALSERISEVLSAAGDGKLPFLDLTEEELDFLKTDKAFSMFYGGGKVSDRIERVENDITELNTKYTAGVEEMHTVLEEITKTISEVTNDENQVELDLDNTEQEEIKSDDPVSQPDTEVTPEETKPQKPISATPKEVDKFVKQFKKNILTYGVNKSFVKSDDDIRALSQSIKKSALATLDCSAEIKSVISTLYSI